MSFQEPGEDDKERERIRRAIETIVGHSFDDEPWPEDSLKPGTRVRVVKDPDWDGPWRQEFEGFIDTIRPPRLVTHAIIEPGEYIYWVKFDGPQMDTTDLGPYETAEVWGRHIVPIGALDEDASDEIP